MAETRRLSEWDPMVAAPLTRKFEGCSLKAYKCPAGKWTIGYGDRKMPDGSPVMAGKRITQEEAESMLRRSLTDARNAAARHCTVPLTEGQAGAIIDFVYNVGEGSFSRSTLCRKLKGMPGTATDCAYEFKKWRYAGGRELPGLVLRREEEKAWFQGEYKHDRTLTH